MIKKCSICGKEFVGKVKNSIYCSSECRTIGKKQYSYNYRHNNISNIKAYKQQYRKKANKAKQNNESNFKSIVDINKNAKELGMSYGEYVCYLNCGGFKNA